MTPKFVGGLMFIIIVACFITGILVYPALPLQALSHWNAAGQADGSMSRIWAAFLLPAIMLVLFAVWAWLPRIDPINTGYKSFRYIYDFFWFLIMAFLAYVYALSLGANLGWQFNFAQALMPALAIVIFILGSLMPYIKRNWFFGIRTPWTLSSDRVWEKTHEFGGRLFQFAGLIIGASSFSSGRWSVWFIVWPLILAGLVSVIYSYAIFSKDRHRQP